jgi:hypothetical protein
MEAVLFSNAGFLFRVGRGHFFHVDRLGQIDAPKQRLLIEFAKAHVAIVLVVRGRGRTSHVKRILQRGYLDVPRIEPGHVQADVESAVLLGQLRFRNAEQVVFSAHSVVDGEPLARAATLSLSVQCVVACIKQKKVVDNTKRRRGAAARLRYLHDNEYK